MIRLLTILLLAASQAFAADDTALVRSSAVLDLRPQNSIGNVSNNGGIVTIGQSGGVTAQTITLNQAPIQWSTTSDLPSRIWATRKQDGTIILYNVTCVRHSTVQAETICTPNKEVRQ